MCKSISGFVCFILTLLPLFAQDVHLSLGNLNPDDNTLELLVDNDVLIIGVQIQLSLGDIQNPMDAVPLTASGGLAEEAGWMVSLNQSGLVLGFSLVNEPIMPGEGILTIIEFDDLTGEETICFDTAIISGEGSQPQTYLLDPPLDDCGICGGGNIEITEGFFEGPDADCAGVCLGDAFIDECGCVGGSTGDEPGWCFGCTDPAALNFDPDATLDDGSCEYSEILPPQNLQAFPGVGEILLDWDPAELQVAREDVTLYISQASETEVSVYMVNVEDVYGFQIDINTDPAGQFNFTNPHGGSAEAAGFLVNCNTDGLLLGFSLVGSYIPAGEGILTTVNWSPGNYSGFLGITITNVAGEHGTPLSYTTEAPYYYTPGGNPTALYNIYRDGALISASIQATSFTDTGLAPETTYCYTVTAVQDDEESAHSNQACATTLVDPLEPVISVDPQAFDLALFSGNDSDHIMTIGNEGEMMLEYSIEILEVDLDPQQSVPNPPPIIVPESELNHSGDDHQRPESYYGTFSSSRPDGHVLVVRDFMPWGGDCVPYWLDLGATVTVIPSFELSNTNLQDYDVIYWGGDVHEYDDLYLFIDQEMDNLEAYVNQGGVIFAAIGSQGTFQATLPGGVVASHDVGDDAYVVMEHCITADLPDSFCGNAAYHDSFTNLVDGTEVVLHGLEDQPIGIQYSLGFGEMFLLGTPSEFYFNQGDCQEDNLRLWTNTAGCALESAQINWLNVQPTSGIIAGGGEELITVTVSAEGLLGGMYMAEIMIDSNDPATPQVIVPVSLDVTGAPSISVPDEFDFGMTFVDEPAVDTLLIANQGTDELIISGLTFTDDPFSGLLDPAELPLSILPGESFLLAMQFLPTAPGIHESDLTIASNDPVFPDLDVTLVGNALLPPIIQVEPESINTELYVGDQDSSQVITITNIGDSDLNWAITLSDDEPELIPEARDRMLLENEDYVRSLDLSDRETLGGQPQSVPIELFSQLTTMRERELDVLFLHTFSYPFSLMDSLAAAPLDLWGFSTPPLNLLISYDAVIVASSSSWDYPVEIGDLLADYSDVGGALLMMGATFWEDGGWYPDGRIQEPEYLPLNTLGGGIHTGQVILQTLVPHAITAGVITMSTDTWGDVDVQGDGIILGYWDSGDPLAAYNPNRKIMAFNLYCRDGHWAGDVPRFLDNALDWLTDDWITVDPLSGTVPAGDSADLQVIFNTEDLFGGIYSTNVFISSNDPVTPVVEIPVNMLLTGAPNIQVNQENIDWGEVFIGGEYPIDLIIENVGTDLLEVTDVVIEPDEVFTSPVSLNIPAGESIPLPVTFIPVDIDDYSAVLTLTCNDPDMPEIQISLTGSGILPPVIQVLPEVLSADLYVGDVEQQELEISNVGDYELEWFLTIETPNPLMSPTERRYLLRENLEYVLGLDPSERQFLGGEAADIPLDFIYSLDTRNRETEVLFLHTFSPNIELMDSLETAPIDLWGYATPDLEFLLTYDVVIVASLGDWDNPDEIGELLADFSDAGGALLLMCGAFWQGGEWYPAGRIQEPDYTPLQSNVGDIFGGSADLQNIVPHELTSGVEVMWTNTWGGAYLQGDAMELGTWDDGYPFAAYNPHRPIVALNLYCGNGNWGGDVPLFINNVINWLDVYWLSITPQSGIVAVGESTILQVDFSAVDVLGGEYVADILIESNDPLTPILTVPVAMTVTGAPNMVVWPESIHILQTYIGDQDTVFFHIDNVGTDELEVTASYTGQGEFTLPVGELNIQPGHTYELPVIFHPTELGPQVATITLFSNDPDLPEVTVSAHGNGVDPPIIVLDPQALSADLFTEEAETQELIISNAGGSPLDWALTIESDEGDGLTLLERRQLLGENQLRASRQSDTPHILDGAENQTGLSFVRELGEQLRYLDLDVLILHTFSDGFTLNDSLDINTVDMLEDAVPSLDLLLAYDAVLVASSSAWDDGYATGNILAEYVDAGGSLIIMGATFYGIGNWILEGAIQEPGYNPLAMCDYFNPGSFISLDDIYPHPITHGITELSTGLWGAAVVQGNGISLGTWDDGYSFAAYNPDKNIVAINLYPRDDQWMGELIPLLTNTLRWMTQSWLTIDPMAGTVESGGSVTVDVTFDADDLLGGDYLAEIIVTSNDPLHSELIIPVELIVTGAPSLAADPELLDFGYVFTNGEYDLQLQLANNGTDLLNITGFQASGGEFIIPDTTLALVPYEMINLVISFAPTIPGIQQETLTIFSNDPANPEFQITMSGSVDDPPIIQVDPTELFYDLYTGDIDSSQVITVSNPGASPLSWSASVSLDRESVLDDEQHSLLLARNRQYCAARTPSAPAECYRPGIESNISSLLPLFSILSREDLNVLFLHTFDWNPEFLDQMADINVDFWGFSTPDLEFLTGYKLVIVASNGWWDNPLGTGNVLADYVDAGGAVILMGGSFSIGGDWCLGGRIQEPSYNPLVQADYDIDEWEFNSVAEFFPHALLNAVTSLSTAIWSYSDPQGNGVSLGTYIEGGHFAAYQQDNPVIAINLYPQDGFWDGDLVQLMDNCADWLIDHWLTVDPVEGTIPPGEEQEITVTVDSIDLLGGVYTAEIVLDSNDPVTPQLSIPVTLDLTGAANIEADPLSLAFPETFVNGSTSASLIIGNSGTDQLEVLGFEITGGEFMVEDDPFLLPVGEEYNLSVLFTPTTTGFQQGELVIISNDPNESQLTISLSGLGVLPPFMTVSPDSLWEDLITGETAVQFLTVGNTGEANLHFWLEFVYDDEPGPVFNNPPPAIGNAPHFSSSLEGSADDSRYFGTYGDLRTDAQVLVVRDVIPWNGDCVPYWVDMGATVTVVSSDDLLTTDLAAFDLLYWGGRQSFDSTFYLNIAGKTPEIEAFLENGGIVFSATGSSSGGDNFVLPGGPLATYQFGNEHHVGMAHCATESLPDTICGNAAYHNIFSDLPPGTNIFMHGDDDVPVGIDFEYGAGYVIYIGQPGEHYLGGGGGCTGDNVQLWLNCAQCALDAIDTQLEFNWLSSVVEEGVLLPGSTLNIPVYFDTADLLGGEYSANIMLTSDDPLNALVQVPVTMSVTGAPLMSIGPDNLQFGDVVVDDMVSRAIAISNGGTDILLISDVILTGGEFTVSPMQMDVLPGETDSLLVEFNPTALGYQEASLTVLSNDPYLPTWDCSLSGTGVPPPEMVIGPLEFHYDLFTGDLDNSQSFFISNTGGSNLIWSADLSDFGPGLLLETDPEQAFPAAPGEVLNRSASLVHEAEMMDDSGIRTDKSSGTMSRDGALSQTGLIHGSAEVPVVPNPLGSVNTLSLQLEDEWLTLEPPAGAVPANDSMPVVISVDAEYLQGGEYAGNIVILSNDPDLPEVTIGITVTVDQYGCMDPEAANYNPNATFDDGSCVYLGTPLNLEAMGGNGEIYLTWDPPAPPAQRTDVILTVSNANENELSIYMENTQDLYGFQFQIETDGFTAEFGDPWGGTAAAAGFNLVSNELGIVLGFALDDSFIPAGEGLLVNISWTPDGMDGWVQLSNLLLAGNQGVQLEAETGPPFCYGECVEELLYNIYRDGALHVTEHPETSYHDTGMGFLETHCYTVTSTLSGEESDHSTEACGTTDSPFQSDDALALIALYQSTGGENWISSGNWLLEPDVCTWSGVNCDEFGRVSELYFNNNNMIGPIPPEIGLLSHLVRFQIIYDQITGPLPDEIGDLINLVEIRFLENNITDQLPATMGNLTELEILYLNNNNLTGSIPAEFCNLESLLYLRLDSNQLDGTVPECLCDLTLDWSTPSAFDVSENALCPPFPDCLAGYVGQQSCVPAPYELEAEGGENQIALNWFVYEMPESAADVLIYISEATEEYVTVYIENIEPFYGFQFQILTDEHFGAVFGDVIDGLAVDAEFLISGNPTGTYLGFSLTGNFIPPGEGVLARFEWTPVGTDGYLDLDITNLAGQFGSALSYTVGTPHCFGDCPDLDTYTYNIYRDNALYATGIEPQSFVDTGLGFYETHCYVVTQTNDLDESTPSNEACATTNPSGTTHFIVSISETGESSPIVIDSIIGLDAGDEVGLYDPVGLLSDGDCSAEYGELLVGAGVWNGTQLEIDAIGSLDFCDSGGFQSPGYVAGNPILFRAWRQADDQEYPVTALYSTGEGFWGQALTVADLEVNDTMESQLVIQPNRNNLFSFNVMLADFTTMGVLGNQFLAVWNDAGEYYVPSYNIDMIGNLDIHDGYKGFLLGTDPLEINLEGVPISTDTELSIYPYMMNILPYLPQRPMETEWVFGGLEDEILLITNDSGQFWVPSLDVYTLQMMEPGEAYVIALTGGEPITFSYPPEVVLPRPDVIAAMLDYEADTQTRHYEVIPTGMAYPVIITQVCAEIEVGDELAVYAGNSVVGAVRVANPTQIQVIPAWSAIHEFGLNLPGYSAGDEMEIRLWDADRNIELPLEAALDVDVFGMAALSSGMITGIADAVMPESFYLHPAYPNPFNPVTTVRYDLPRDSHVQLSVFDLAGRQMAMLVNDHMVSGHHSIEWDATGEASGVYILKLKAGNVTRAQKILLLK